MISLKHLDEEYEKRVPPEIRKLVYMEYLGRIKDLRKRKREKEVRDRWFTNSKYVLVITYLVFGGLDVTGNILTCQNSIPVVGIANFHLGNNKPEILFFSAPVPEAQC